MDNLLTILSNMEAIKDSIVLEGLPFSGKTHFICSNFACQAGVDIIDEHMLFESKLPSYVTDAWPQGKVEDIITRQVFFLDMEAERQKNLGNASLNRTVFDRGVLSVIVYFLARIEYEEEKLREELLDSFIRVLSKYIDNKSIRLPQEILFMDTELDLICERSLEDNSRNCEDFLLIRDNQINIRNYYLKILDKLRLSDCFNVKFVKGDFYVT